MAIETAATPEGATAMNDDESIAAAFAALDNDDGVESPEQLAEDPVDGDADPAAEQGDDAEPPEGEEKPEATEAPALDMAAIVKVKVNGEDIEVPLEEALKGYSRTEDYSRKTAALAEQGRALHGELAERLQTALEIFVQADPILAQTRDIDWAELARTEPSTYVALKAELDQRHGIIADVQGRIAEARAAETQATIQREYELLVKADPSLADAETYDKRIDGIRDYLTRSHGFSPAELNAINNHKYVLIAEKAAAYDKLMTAKKELPAKTAPPPAPQSRPMKSGSAQPPRTSPKLAPTASQAQQKAWFDKYA